MSWHLVGKGIGKGLAWLWRRPGLVEAVVEAAATKKIDKRTLAKIGEALTTPKP